jgi:hypothetical protein
MWFWIGVAAVAVAVYLLLRWKDRGGTRPFYQTREETGGSDKYGSLTRPPRDKHRNT